MRRAIFGIHMGNSSMCLSVHNRQEERLEIVATPQGERCVPAYVAATPTYDEFIVGTQAKQNFPNDSQFTVVNNLQFLFPNALTNAELTYATKNSHCKFMQAADELVYRMLDYKGNETRATPQQVAVKLFENVYDTASAAYPTVLDFAAVLAVPTRFFESADNVKSLANQAGFNVLAVIAEPCAALIAYKIGFIDTECSNVLIYRSGGLTTDLDLYRIENGRYLLLDYVHLPYGGNLLTQAFDDFIVQTERSKLSARQYYETKLVFNASAEHIKHVVTTYAEPADTYYKIGDYSFESVGVTQETLENAIAPKMPLFIQPILDLLDRNQKTVDKVILCGGNTRIHKLESSIRSVLPNASILNTIEPDKVIALGCAQHAVFKNAENIANNVASNADDDAALHMEEIPEAEEYSLSTINANKYVNWNALAVENSENEPDDADAPVNLQLIESLHPYPDDETSENDEIFSLSPLSVHVDDSD